MAEALYPTDQRGTAWRAFLLPVVLALVMLLGYWLWPFVAYSNAVREAVPVAGPGDTIMVHMTAGTSYLIYQRAGIIEAGRDCQFGSPDHTVGGLGAGGSSYGGMVYRGIPSAVSFNGETYRFASTMSNLDDRDVPVSCKGGPVLAEVMPGYRPWAITAAVVAVAIIALSLGWAVWSVLRRRTQEAS